MKRRPRNTQLVTWDDSDERSGVWIADGFTEIFLDLDGMRRVRNFLHHAVLYVDERKAK
jgi:hypothetical protein